MAIAKKKGPASLSAVALLAKRLTEIVVARYPQTRFVLTKGQEEPHTYLLHVLDAPVSELDTLNLVSRETLDILEKHDVLILVVPHSRRYSRDLLKTFDIANGSAVEIALTKDAA